MPDRDTATATTINQRDTERAGCLSGPNRENQKSGYPDENPGTHHAAPVNRAGNVICRLEQDVEAQAERAEFRAFRDLNGVRVHIFRDAELVAKLGLQFERDRGQGDLDANTHVSR